VCVYEDQTMGVPGRACIQGGVGVVVVVVGGDGGGPRLPTTPWDNDNNNENEEVSLSGATDHVERCRGRRG